MRLVYNFCGTASLSRFRKIASATLKRMLICSVVIFGVIISPECIIAQPLSGPYSINSGIPTGGNNFQTFSAAISALVANGVGGPVTFDVAPGSGPYTEHPSIPSITGASATNTITFNGNGQTLQFGPTSSDISIIDLNGADYITFDNFIIVGTSTGYGVGVLLRNGADYNRITNCTINLSAITSTTSTVSAYIAASNSITTTATAGNTANYCLFQGNQMLGGASGGPYYGIRINGTSSTSAAMSNSFIYNTIQDFYAHCFYCTYTNGTTILGNDISRPNRTASTTIYGIYMINGNRNEVIEKNRIHNVFDGAPTSTAAAYGIAFATPNTPSGSETTVKNNLIYNFNGNGEHRGINGTGIQNVRFYHNTISFDNAAATAGATYGIYVSSSTTAPGGDFKNNIITITRGGTGTKYVIYFSGTVVASSNYNDLYLNAPAGTNYYGYYNTSNFATFANWQTANGGIYDQNSVTGDPLYENPAVGNLKPQASIVNNVGTNLSTAGCMCVTDDFLGIPRSTTPDLGAYEFIPSPMTVTSITTTQPITTPVTPSSTDQLIIGIQIATLGALSPLTATQFNLNTSGSTSSIDIANAKLYYTGASNTFSTGIQFGSTFALPSGSFSITGSQVLAPGTNYFWLVYDIASGSTNCNVVDAECASIIINATPYIPTPIAPAGNRMIRSPFSGTYTINSAGPPSCTVYTSIREAFADLNIVGVGGAVTFNVVAGHTETSANLVLRVPSASATNTITFQKSGSGSNPLITAGVGTSTTLDALIKIVGTDYVTFDGIDLQEAVTNTTTTMQMEWGYAILKAAGPPVDGSDHVTIKNCVITMNKTNTASVGIYQNNHTDANTTQLSPTTMAGTSSDNHFFNNTISNVYTGIYVYGASTASWYDVNNKIGLNGPNSIQDFGGSSSTSYGIYTIYQNNLIIANNTLNNGNVNTTTTYGIYASTATSANTDVYNNSVTMVNSSTTYGIYVTAGGTAAGNTINVYNNTVTNCIVTGIFYGIYLSTTPANAYVYGNTVTSNQCTSTLYGIYMSSNVTTNSMWYNNNVNTLTTTGSSALYGIYHNTTTTTTAKTYGNEVHTLNSSGGSGTVYGIYVGTSLTHDVYKNRVYNTSSASGINRGIFIGAATTTTLYNNYVSDIKSPAGGAGGTSPSVAGIWNAASSGTVNMYYNTVYIDASSTNTSFGSTAVYAATGSTTELRNNIFVNMSVPGAGSGTANTVAYTRSSTTLTSYSTASNKNCLYAGTPGTNNLIFYDGNSDQTLAAYQTRVAPRDALSFTELPPFINIATAPYNLHLNSVTSTQCESGGTPIAGIDDDFDGDIRYGSTGYTGGGAAPDVGADEGNFTGLPCAGTPAGGAAIRTTPLVCIGSPIALTLQGATTGIGITYQWEESDDDGVTDPWSNAIGGSGSTTMNYTTPNYTATIYYRCKVTCSYSTLYSYSTSIGLTNPGMAGPFTINSAVPTGGTNFQSFADAIAALTARGVCGAVTFNVAAGSGPYTEQVSIPSIVGASAVNTITFNGNGRTLRHTPTSSNYSIIDLNGADYVTINNLNIVGLDATYGFGVLLRNQANYNQITNCTIDLSAITSTGSTSAYIVSSASITNVGTTGDNANYCTFQGNTMIGGPAGGPYYGMRLNGSSSFLQASNSIIDNTIQDFYYYGIYLYYTNGTIVRSNDLSRPYRSSVSNFYAIACATSSRSEIIEKNRLHNPFDGFPTSTSTSYPIYISSPATPAGSEITVRNNLVYNMNGNGTIGGIYCSSASNVRLYHNSISLDNASSTAGTTYGFYITGTAAPGPDFKNNVVTITRGGTGTKYCVYISGAGAGSSNYNDLYINCPAGTNYTGYYNGSTFVTLANWQTANGSIYDQNSVAVDPVYENPFGGNLRPQAAGVNNLGTNLSTAGCMCVTDDFLANARSTTPDMGAYEFTPQNMAMVSTTTTQTNTSPVAVGSINQHIIGIQIVTIGVTNPLSVTSFSLNTNGTTSTTDILNAKLYYTGKNPTFATTNQFGSTVASPSGSYNIIGSQQLEAGTNYFWLTYDISSSAINNNLLDAECTSLTVGSPFTPTVTAPPGSRTIIGAMSGAYNVGAGTTFPKLSDAFNMINTVGLSGHTTLNIVSNITESSTATLNQWTETPPSSNYTLKIQPSGGAARMISGNLSGSATGAVIKLYGADRVTIDGLNTGGNSLTIANTSTSTQAVIWINSLGTGAGATNVTIRNCTISGGTNTSSAAYGILANGGTSITTTASTSDNDNLTIENNIIKKTWYGIYVAATTPGLMDGLLISGNTVGATTSSEYVSYRGIDLQGAVAPIISQNIIINIFDPYYGYTVSGIEIGPYVSDATIVRNKIQGLRSLYWDSSVLSFGAYGINVNTATGVDNLLIANNMLCDILAYGNATSTTYNAFGIRLTGGTNIKLYYNSIYLSGSLTDYGYTASLLVTTTAVTGLDVRNNIFMNSITGPSSTKSYSIYVPTGFIFGTINYNDYFVSGTYGVLGYYGADKTTLAAWRTSSGQDINSVNVNPLFMSTTDLHINSGTTPTQLESGGTVISGLNVDFDNQTRPGPPGSTNGGGTVPDIGCDEFDGVPLDLFPPIISYIPLTNGIVASTRALPNFATITDVSGINSSSGTRPRVYYKKSIDANTFVGNSSTDNGWKWIEASNTTSPFSFTIDYNIINGGSVSISDVIQYFVVAQDNAPIANVGINSGTFNSQPVSVNLVPVNFPISGTINSYAIGGLISGTINVGATETITSLTNNGGLFETINGSLLSGDVTVNITSDLTAETGTHALNQWSESGIGGYRMQIQPNAAVERLITGSVANSMIRINGADRLTIDGSSGGLGRYLRFRNQNSSYPTIELLNNSTNDRLLNCVIEGGNTNSASGVLVFGASTTGNSNNSIIGCDIRDRSDIAAVPANLVYSSSINNSADSLKNNILHDYTANAVYIPASGCGDVWQFLTNGIYQTATRTTQLRGIYVLSGNGHTILANNFGGAASDRSGPALSTTITTTPGITPIHLAVGSSLTTVVSKNTIGNINLSSAGFYGIYLTSGNVSVSDNRIGDAVLTSDTIKAASSTSYGIYYSGGMNLTASNDTIGNITTTSTCYPIYLTSGNLTASNNLIKHNSAGSTLYGIYATGSGLNSITDNMITDQTATSTFYGIYVPATGTNIITGNTLSSLYNIGNMYVIYITGSNAINTVSSNTISNCTSTGAFYGIYMSGTTPTDVITGNTIEDLTNNTTGTSALGGIYVTASGTNSITGNIVRRLTQNSSSATPTAALYGIYVTAGSWNRIQNNTVDSLKNTTVQGGIRGVLVSGGTGNTLSGNTISRIWSQNNEPKVNKGVAYGVQFSAGIDTILNNTVYSINTAYDTSASTFGAMGIGLGAATANNIVRQNTIYNIHNHNTGSLATISTGLFVGSTLTPTTVSRNRIYNVTGAGTGTGTAAPSISGIYNSSNAVFSNNMVSIGTDVGNEVIAAGIADFSAGATSWYYNSSFIGGTLSGGTNNSYAFSRGGTDAIDLRNNLFYNNRTGGTGAHYAAGNLAATPATGWSATSSDYNLFVAPDPTKIGEWGIGVPRSLAGWQSSSGGDFYSLTTTTATVTPFNLFTNVLTADLDIVTTNPECWYVNGKGIAGSVSGSIADDYSATSVRSTTTGIATDIGADEFNTSITPPAAAASSAPANNSTTTYSFGGQTLASITWGSGGAVPSAIDFRYYSGINPPPPLTGNYSNAYCSITATGGSGFTYDITFGYSPAWLGTITSETNIKLAKQDAGIWAYLSTSTVNTTNKTVTQTGLTTFSEFALTDVTNPLPVELVVFNAVLHEKMVRLTWKTMSEFNTLQFIVERRTESSRSWEEIGSLPAQGATDTPMIYEFSDEHLPNSGEIFYRLRMVDRNGSYEYSNEVRVSLKTVDSFVLYGNYPNPFELGTSISFGLPQEEFVTILVYDPSGREIETLMSKALPAGVHSVAFYGKNLPSGVYRYVVIAGSQQKTAKMVFVR